MKHIALPILALSLATVAACGAGDDQSWGDGDTSADTVAVQPTPEMRAQFTALRSEVDSVVGHLRSEVESRQQSVSGATLEQWTDTYARVAEQRGDLLVKLDELDRASADEARSIRNDVATELADLEADVVRQKLRLNGSDQASSAAVEEHLVRLEQNLDSIESRSLAFSGQPGAMARRDSGAWNTGNDRDRRDHLPDMDEIRNLRNDIQEARRDAAELRMTSGDDRRDHMDNVSDRVADLTRDVRRHWYNTRYSFMGPGTTSDLNRQRMGGDTRD